MKVIPIISLVIVFSVTLVGGQIQNDSIPGNGVNREGMFVSIGLGGTWLNTQSTIDNESLRLSKYKESNFAEILYFKIGHAINTNWTIYGQLQWLTVDEHTLENARSSSGHISEFIYIMAGLGTTFYHRKTGPSLYHNVSVGLATRENLNTLRFNPETGNGWCFSVGTGYQFANRWSVEANLFFAKVKGKPKNYDHWETQLWSPQITVHYMWYRSFKKARLMKLGKIQTIPRTVAINRANLGRYFNQGDKIKVTTHDGFTYKFKIVSIEETYIVGNNIRVPYSVIENIELYP